MTEQNIAAEVRRVETEVVETGVGQANRTDVTYEVGASIEGAWIRFASVPAGVVDAAVQRARDQRSQEQANAPQQASEGTQGGEQSAPPNEQGGTV